MQCSVCLVHLGRSASFAALVDGIIQSFQLSVVVASEQQCDRLLSNHCSS